MGKESGHTGTVIAAVILSHHKVPSGGEAFIVEAKDEKEQEKLMMEMSKALKGDVTRLSNGMYLILKT